MTSLASLSTVPFSLTASSDTLHPEPRRDLGVRALEILRIDHFVELVGFIWGWLQPCPDISERALKRIGIGRRIE